MTARTAKVLRTIRDVVLSLVVGSLLLASVVAIIQSATKQHWIAGASVTLFYAYAVYLGISDLRSLQARQFPVHKVVAIFFATVMTGVAVAASASWLLLRAGWAIYDPVPHEEHAYSTFITYFFWVFLDMLPGLEIPELLNLQSPLKPKNSLAGIPVISFRAFVLFGVLAALKFWWRGREQPSASSRPQVTNDN